MPSMSEKYTEETVTWVRTWVPEKLFSFRTTRFSGLRFAPGQFLRLGVRKISAGKPAEIAWRAYSVASANYEEHLEFFSIVIPDGEFTSELKRLKVGDSLYVEKQPYGFLTTSRFENGKDLWLLSSGTGLAPFLSILWDPEVWQNYENIVLVHCVRDAEELVYQETIHSYCQHELIADFCKLQDKKLIYIPIVTRGSSDFKLTDRIPLLIRNGELERSAGLKLDLDRSRIMVCGNPDMVDDIRKCLGEFGYKTSRRSQPGQIAVENYW